MILRMMRLDLIQSEYEIHPDPSSVCERQNMKICSLRLMKKALITCTLKRLIAFNQRSCSGSGRYRFVGKTKHDNQNAKIDR